MTMLNAKTGTGGPRPTPPLPATADPAQAALNFLALLGDPAGAQAARIHLAEVLAAREANDSVLAEVRAESDALQARIDAAHHAEDAARAARAQADGAASDLRQLQSDKAAALAAEERRLTQLAASLDERGRDLERREYGLRQAKRTLDGIGP
jgi:chromosome segregation ATPase